MLDTVTVYLPLSTYVSVNCYTNASFNQQVTITPESGTATVLTGSGEHNTPMQNGAFSIQTPATSSSTLGYKVTVMVQSAQQNGQWAPSQVTSGGCSVMYYSAVIVVSEDFVDADWNDAVVIFTWWTPPSSRSAVRAGQIMAGKRGGRVGGAP